MKDDYLLYRHGIAYYVILHEKSRQWTLLPLGMIIPLFPPISPTPYAAVVKDNAGSSKYTACPFYILAYSTMMVTASYLFLPGTGPREIIVMH